MLLIWLLMFSVPCTSDSFDAEDYFLFTTFHGAILDVDNIYMYSLSGELLSENVISNAEEKKLKGLRSLRYEPTLKSVLFTNSNTEDSRIMLLNTSEASDFSCTGSGLAQYYLVSDTLVHPYGVDVGFNGNDILVSNQGDPKNPPQTIMHYIFSGYEYTASIFAEVHTPRGLLTMQLGDTRRVFVCDKGTDSVLQFDSQGQQVDGFKLAVKNPIALCALYDSAIVGSNPWILVSSNDNEKPAVYAFDAQSGGSFKIYKRRFEHSHLVHPCGIDILGDTLYALSQDTKKLLTFSLTSGQFLRILVPNLPDRPEDVIVMKRSACSKEWQQSTMKTTNKNKLKKKKKKGKDKG